MNKREYRDFINMVARNGLEMGENPRTVAKSVLVDTQRVPGETAILYSGEPFVDEPTKQTRLWPKDVIQGRSNHYPPIEGSVYDLALDCLKSDIYQSMMEIENQTIRNKYPGDGE